MAEGFEEFSSLGFFLVAGQVVSVASFQGAVDGFRLVSLVVSSEECGLVFQLEGLAVSFSDHDVPFRRDDLVAAFHGYEVEVAT